MRIFFTPQNVIVKIKEQDPHQLVSRAKLVHGYLSDATLQVSVFLLSGGQSSSSLWSYGQSICPSQRRAEAMQGPFSQRHSFRWHPSRSDAWTNLLYLLLFVTRTQVLKFTHDLIPTKNLIILAFFRLFLQYWEPALRYSNTGSVALLANQLLINFINQ